MTKVFNKENIIPINGGYVIVDNEVSIQESDWYLYDNVSIIQANGLIGFHETVKDRCLKILASIGIKIEGVPLIEEVDEVEKMATVNNPHLICYKGEGGLGEQVYVSAIKNFKDGYKANTKQYSEEDMRKAFEAGQLDKSNNWYGGEFSQFIKTIQKVPISVELEYELDMDDDWNYNPERGEDYHYKLNLYHQLFSETY